MFNSPGDKIGLKKLTFMDRVCQAMPQATDDRVRAHERSDDRTKRILE
jgi:hypothetical protein